jgi:hypothetical protein
MNEDMNEKLFNERTNRNDVSRRSDVIKQQVSMATTIADVRRY